MKRSQRIGLVLLIYVTPLYWNQIIDGVGVAMYVIGAFLGLFAIMVCWDWD